MPQTSAVEEKSEEGFEVFKIPASVPVRFQTEPTGPGSETVFLFKLTPMVRFATEPDFAKKLPN